MRPRNSRRHERDADLLSAELLSIEQLKRLAAATAGQQRIDPRPGPDKLLRRLADNERVLLEAYDIVTAATQPEQRIVPAEAWLLDNFYLIEQQIHLARRHLPRSYSRQLPRLADGVLAGLPRIYGLALDLISHQDGRVEHDNVNQFVASYQSVVPLKLGELWAFPIMLRLALLENLRRVGSRIARRREERDTAIAWADRMLAAAEKEPRQLIQLLAQFADTNAEVPLTGPFVEEFYGRLQGQGPAMAFAQTWVEHQLLQEGMTAAQLLQIESRTGAANQIAIANSIGSLRFISAVDWTEFVETHSVVEQTLRGDPAGAHARQDFATRDFYRHVVEDVARDSARSEVAVAAVALDLARAAEARAGKKDRTAHVGYYLIDGGRDELEAVAGCRRSAKSLAARIARRWRLALYLGAIVLLTALVTAVILASDTGLGLGDWRYWLFALTGALSASALAVQIVNRLVVLMVPPRPLPRLDFSNGIPVEHRTMAVVPTLLGTPQDVADLLEALEIRYLGNRDANLFFALLTDFRDAPRRVEPDDDTLLAQVRDGIKLLNEKYRDDRPGIFCLFHRPRTWNETERLWMGYERKRGKLEQFNALLGAAAAARTGDDGNAFSDTVVERSMLASIAYVITLDTDTQLPRDAAHKLVGNMAHPLNQPVYSQDKRRVVAGYAILQPLASVGLTSASRSRFARTFAPEPGIDPYTREVSDVYQDLFGEGTVVGTGLYHVDAFRLAIDGRFPENLILSHDLLESGYARSALVADVDFIEDHPVTSQMEASRRHRWIRGDWQIAAWLLPRVPGPRGKRQVNPLSALSRWKILDNLRRSLVAPALLALLIAGWMLVPGSTLTWTLLVAAIVFLPPIFSMLLDLMRKPREHAWLWHVLWIGESLGRPVARAFLSVAQLPYDAFICISAILQSGVRMLFTRRGLLLWYTRSYARRNARTTLPETYFEMWVAPVLALGLAAAVTVARPSQLPYCTPLLLLWLAAPGIAWWLNTPLRRAAPDLTADQLVFLRLLARRTWRYFSDFVAPLDNWLPPDNLQEYPTQMIAERTSPTNIGMGLLANLGAYDLGYISAGELLRRTESTFATMEKLERYRGHFYNWYDTRTLQPLRPQYVSSVDSGNLAASLLTLHAGLAELKEQPVLPPCAFQGLEDTFLVAVEHLPSPASPDLTRNIAALRRAFQERPRALARAEPHLKEIQRACADALSALPGSTDGELHAWMQALDRQARDLQDDLRFVVCDYSPSPNYAQTLSELARGGATADPVTGAEAQPRVARYEGAEERIKTIEDLMERCRTLATMDFEFLYDTSCGLLAIGYDVGERRRDTSHYDLLASEARLTSFMLIAQQQVPTKHWFALGRSLTTYGGDPTLLSWSGSMFEYLMPQLWMPAYENTLLEQTCKAAVSRHIEYARQRGVLWGISESCYNATDARYVYQYRAFGVPGLGFKRGLADDLVIAPYASALALSVMPRQACRNLQSLAASGFLGQYGLYEAIDYTPSRVPPGMEYAIVRSFMAHHQGMSLLAFVNVLRDRPMQRRFMSDPQLRTTELLLQERVPKRGPTLHPHGPEVSAAARPAALEPGVNMRVFTDPDTPLPEVHLLSNGRYHVMATNAGGGYSRWQDLAITRWREDATRDCWGTCIYLRDRDTGRYWSTAHQPTLRKPDHYEAIFVQARAEYRRRDHGIETHTEISVSPEDDVEIRRVTLTNLSSQTRRIEITSYAEVVLAPHNSDLAHRVFSNLFVQTEIVPGRGILCTRRRRMPEERPPWMLHLLAAPGATVDEASCETDRARFIGRCRTTANPAALEGNTSAKLSNSAGSVLDPIVAIRRTVMLEPDASASVQIISGIAETRAGALALLEKYGERHFVERAFEMAWSQSQESLRQLGMTEADAQLYGRLATSVIHANVGRRAAPSIIARNQLGQSRLWRFAISGDLPIVLVRIGDVNKLDLVKQALQAHAYWRTKGLAADLVILNEDFSGYRAVLQDQIMGLINAGPSALLIDRPGGVFVRRAEELAEDDRVLFQTAARVVLSDTAETLAEQVKRRVPPERMPDRLQPTRSRAEEAIRPLLSRERVFSNGLGGFTADAREYVITLEPGDVTPAPWANVIASPHIGTVVSECGSSYTWVENAHEFRLTTWHNDPLADSSGEALYIRDEETGAFWSPTPMPARGASGYVCRHGFGYSMFEHFETGLASELSVCVAMDAPVKLVALRIRNDSGRSRRLSVTGYWELVLGEWRHATSMHVVTETDAHTGALFARNAFGREFADRIVFVQISEPTRTVSGNRTEFIGRNGSLASPAAMRRVRLSGKTGAGLDPCAAVQAPIELADGQTREVVFLIGAAGNVDEAHRYIARFGGLAGAHEALDAVWRYWNHTLGAVNVDTPDRALNALANGWLVYQTLSCRVWGRSGYYQSGGAYGFRDQLQDTMALIHAVPALAREQILRCAERQFRRGDVQHWWHPPSGRGVRTQFSDDYLWLPYATCHYVLATGDTGVLDEPLHFLEGRELNAEEESYYDLPQRSTETASLYEHCTRAIKHGLRFGEHGLPLIGCGDWNDGMNLIGRHGKGESVWLAWFLYDNLQLFGRLAAARNDEELARLCVEHAERLRANVEAHAWDGAWYRRAYFDDGSPLGSSLNEECQIDSISQSWAVISQAGDPARARRAMAAVDRRLVRREDRLILLLDPPFDKSSLEPGYIKAYVPGVRENGGQYTHAAIWSAMAFAMMGDREAAWALFSMLNPIHHGTRAEDIATYKVEPYVMCADVYSAAGHVGRGGWTWYTGAAGWMYRLALETLLGLQLQVDKLRLAPRIPDEWPEYRIHYRYRATTYHLNVRRDGPKPLVVLSLKVDGVTIDGTGQSHCTIPLVDDHREHHVEVALG
jgi:cellobiose phosphorylase